MKDNLSQISDRTLERLPGYHHILRELHNEGVKYVSSTSIASRIGLNPIQVRKDISLTGIVGKPKIGYEVEELLNYLDEFMGWNKENKAVLVGCGNLGLSLMSYQGFKRYGFEIIAGFDINEKSIASDCIKPIYNISKLADFIKKNNIEIGIITVNESSAQEIADIFVKNGIKAIWNFAPVSLTTPDDVVVQQQDMSPSLAILIKKINISKICKQNQIHKKI